MNIRKSVNYSEMYAALDIAVADVYSRMQMHAKIGTVVCNSLQIKCQAQIELDGKRASNVQKQKKGKTNRPPQKRRPKKSGRDY